MIEPSGRTRRRKLSPGSLSRSVQQHDNALFVLDWFQNHPLLITAVGALTCVTCVTYFLQRLSTQCWLVYGLASRWRFGVLLLRNWTFLS